MHDPRTNIPAVGFSTVCATCMETLVHCSTLLEILVHLLTNHSPPFGVVSSVVLQLMQNLGLFHHQKTSFYIWYSYISCLNSTCMINWLHYNTCMTNTLTWPYEYEQQVTIRAWSTSWQDNTWMTICCMTYVSTRARSRWHDDMNMINRLTWRCVHDQQIDMTIRPWSTD